MWYNIYIGWGIQLQGEILMAVTGGNPSFKNEDEGRIRNYAFEWIGGGYNDVWAAHEYDAIILANSWYSATGKIRSLVVNEDTIKDITGNEAEYRKSLPLWD
jgi:hypothetical protein